MRQGDIIAATGADRQPDRPLAAATLIEDPPSPLRGEGRVRGQVYAARFAGWLVERRYLQRSPMIGISVPRRERRLPRVPDWSQVEQIVAG